MTNTHFSSYRDIHAGKTIIVCGCGVSLKTLPHPETYITIGVNDVGRLFAPTYLVVLNMKRQFRGDRYRYIENSQAKAIFTQLNLGLTHPRIVRFRLGKRGGTDLSGQDTLPYTKNSPYVAVCLAAFMGAKRIGLIGVDFTEHHFFARTGKHVLARQIKEINQEYGYLYQALKNQGIQFINLSRQSCLTAVPKQDIADFVQNKSLSTDSNFSAQTKSIDSKSTRSNDMRLVIERHNPGIVGDFLDTLAATAKQLDYEVSRDLRRANSQRGLISVVWNGRNFRSANGLVLYCEHAWLPRWAYQISPNGINADSHIAPFKWDGKELDDDAQQALQRHLDAIRSGGPTQYKYMQTNIAPAEGMPDAFLLVPLQMEWDTNIQRHVPVRYRHMQTLINDISRANPSLPVVYKQHPADVRRGSRQLRLRLSRKQDQIWPHDKGNIHQILKSGHCKGIISLNSNVVHDGLVWGVPSITLGRNIWPRQGMGPFLSSLPADWSELLDAWKDPQRRACRDAYAYYLMQNQWTMDDIRDIQKVAQLLNGMRAPKNPVVKKANVLKPKRTVVKKANVVNIARRNQPVINVTARNLGWFFEDLKMHFLKASGKQAIIRVSDRPRRDADGWIFLRTKEAVTSPRPERSLVQVHDMFDENLYRPRGDRHCVSRCGGIVLTHPEQRNILLTSGIVLENKLVLERPIGALTNFSLRERRSDPFTIAWVGRPAMHFKQDIKRVDWYVNALRLLDGEFRSVLLGERLESQYKALMDAGKDCLYYTKKKYPINCYPRLYKDFDCLVITSISEAGPISLFEALATGVPVVSTPVGWSSLMINNGVNGYLVESVEGIAEAIRDIRNNAQTWFDRRQQIRASLGNYTLESWVDDNIKYALALVEGRGVKPGSDANSLRYTPTKAETTFA